MIDGKSFTREWLGVFRAKKEHKGINVTILEKMVHAFSLLEHLKIAGLDFVFKGGTSLVLLLEEDNRFSIDIDIVSSVRREPLEKILDTVVSSSHFKRHILNERRSYKGGVPRRITLLNSIQLITLTFQEQFCWISFSTVHTILSLLNLLLIHRGFQLMGL